jgi:hypothetical protein
VSLTRYSGTEVPGKGTCSLNFVALSEINMDARHQIVKSTFHRRSQFIDVSAVYLYQEDILTL